MLACAGLRHLTLWELILLKLMYTRACQRRESGRLCKAVQQLTVLLPDHCSQVTARGVQQLTRLQQLRVLRAENAARLGNSTCCCSCATALNLHLRLFIFDW